MVAIATIFYCIHREFSLFFTQTLIHTFCIILLSTYRHNQPQYKIENNRTTDTYDCCHEPY